MPDQPWRWAWVKVSFSSRQGRTLKTSLEGKGMWRKKPIWASGASCRIIAGASQKMLTQTLRSLENDGIVSRKIYPVVPPMVEYSLTPLGRSLIEPLEAICRWAEKHLPELEAARARNARAKPGEGEVAPEP